MNLQPGRVYLVKGAFSMLWWSIKDLPPARLLWKPTSSSLLQHLNHTSPFAEPTTYVVIPQDQQVPTTLNPDAESYVFVFLSEADGTLSKQREKLYKQLAGGNYEQLQLPATVSNDPLVKEWLEQSSLTMDQQTQLLKDFGSNPYRLKWQLQQPLPDIMHYYTLGVSNTEAISLIQSLGTPTSLTLWTDLPRRLLYGLMMTPDMHNCGMYLILAVGSRALKLYGMCPALWVYLEMFITSLLPRYRHQPQLIFKAFVSWVYLATNLWQTTYFKGFHCRRYKQKDYWAFEPSPEAHRQAMLLLGRQL